MVSHKKINSFALVSVFNKTNISFLCKILKQNKVGIISTGSTSKKIKSLGFNCLEISSLTNFNEALDGRVKTLHPKIYISILHNRNNDNHKKAYDEMLAILKKPKTVFAITPDGPQGPAKIPKAGTIRAAQKTGAIIIPVAGQSTKRWSFVNWDTFYVSKPFGAISLFYGKPIFFGKNQDFEECKNILKSALDNLESKAEKHNGME